MAIKTFTNEQLTASDTNTYLANAGLVYITSQTIGTAVSSVTVSNVFTSTYDRYMIVMSGSKSSNSAPNLTMTLGGLTAGSYYSNIIWQTASTATVNGNTYSAVNQWTIGIAGNNEIVLVIDQLNPRSTAGKTGRTQWSSFDGSASTGGTGTLWSTAGNVCTDFTLAPTSGTLTGGIIRVYGYRQA